MSSVEIEDVLSSIRRLVSEDLRPSTRQTPQVEGGEKLILTPALRVVADVVEPVAEVRTLFPEGWDSVPEAGDGHGMGDHVAAWPGDPEDHGPDPVAEHVAQADAPSSDLQTLLDGIANGDNSLSDADNLPDPAGSAMDEPASIEAVVAALGAAVTGQDWEGEAEEAAVEADWSHQGWADASRDELVIKSMGEVDEAEILVSDAIPEDRSWASDDGWGTVGAAALSPTDFSTPPLSDEDRADQAEAEAVAEIQEAEGLVDAAAVMDDTFAASAAADAASTAGGAATRAEPPIGVFDEDDAVVDEEVLRDLVRDIIREELQGALGGRITRNVRKLVRAEINRAMAARQFD